ncbi:P-loop containing nucleoside triphosphate hydrolase protein [Dipodascopsis uninucleata]
MRVTRRTPTKGKTLNISNDEDVDELAISSASPSALRSTQKSIASVRRVTAEPALPRAESKSPKSPAKQRNKSSQNDSKSPSRTTIVQRPKKSNATTSPKKLKEVNLERSVPSTPRKRNSQSTANITPTPSPKKRRLGIDVDEISTPKRKHIVPLTPSKTNPSTPTTARKLFNVITPLPTRVLKTPSALSPLTPHQSARSRLHGASALEALPCRESEFAEIQTALESAIVEQMGSCIYISGTPGTGKTATVKQVIRLLKEQSYDFTFVEINGMKIVQPIQAYTILWEAISERNVPAVHALRLLDEEFKTQLHITKPIVVLMDELDQLVTRSQDVMYNFFNWPSLPSSKLIVVAVANIMDLPERTMTNKISSRLGLTRIQFPGYTHQQLQTIIEYRLKSVPGNIVQPEAIEFASRKVAGVTGDARRALDICRRAVELVEDEIAAQDLLSCSPSRRNRTSLESSKADRKRMPIVTINHIRKAISESTSSPMFQYIPSLPLTCKVLLAGIIHRSRLSGVAENSISSIRDTVIMKLRNFGNLAPYDHLLFGTSGIVDSSLIGIRSFLRAVNQLVECGALICQSNTVERATKVRLRASEVDIRAALREDAIVGKLFLE